MCVKAYLVLVLVLDWTQCLPQGVGAAPSMLRGRTVGFPKKLGGQASGEAGLVDTICTVPQTVAHQPRAGCIRLVHNWAITWYITCGTTLRDTQCVHIILSVQ